MEPVFIPSAQMDFGSPLSMERYVLKARYTEEGLGHPPNDVTDFDDPLWKASLSSGIRWGGGLVGIGRWHGRMGGKGSRGIDI